MNGERFARLHGECRRLARGLRRGRRFAAEEDVADLEQEMAVALLEADGGATDSYCLSRAVWAARGWLRRAYGRGGRAAVRQEGDLVGLVDSGRWRRVWC